MRQHDCKSRGWSLIFFIVIHEDIPYEEKIGKIDCCRFSFTPSLHQVKEKENKKTPKKQMHAWEKLLTAGCLFSDACFRQEVIPLNATLARIPFQLGASTVKSDRHGPNVDPPVSEKERLSEAKQKSEEWPAPSTAVTLNGKMEALDANCALGGVSRRPPMKHRP